MANLSSLVHELRERIAASSSTPPNNGDDVVLETRFRAVLPNLLHTYVVPSSSENEREVIAVLKLLSHTTKNFPGVFYHGKAGAVLPIIGRILPFFAEPAFRSRHGVIFETVGSLLSLLRTGERDAYRQFFIDAMLVVEDILYVAMHHADKASITESTRVLIKCFCESFTGISGDPALLSDLPTSSKPIDGFGIMINLTDKSRWQPFATWIIKLMNKCLTEGTLYVEGLVNSPFVSSACTFLCYGDADLQMACFDFARVLGALINYDIVPHQNLIQSISFILDEAGDGLPVFRNVAYDSSMGGCLHVLHSTCSDDVVKLTAADLINVFPRSILNTKSAELKVALCNAYIRIAKTCPPHIWKPESLIYTLLSSEPCLPLIDCFQVALSILGPDCVGAKTSDTIGGKRPIQDQDTCKSKRQKLEEESMASNAEVHVSCKLSHIVTCEREQEHANYMHTSLLSFVELLKPTVVKDTPFRPEVSLTALSMLCIVFSKYPQTNLSLFITQQIYAWIPWICEQVKQGCSIALDLSIYLEAVHCVLLLQSKAMDLIFFKRFMTPSFGFREINNGDGADFVNIVLKLPFTHSFVLSESNPPWRTKCLSVQVQSKIGPSLKTESILEVLDLGLHDEADEVRIEAVISMPVIVLWSGLDVLRHVFRRLDFLENEKHEKVKKIIPFSLGFLACLYGLCNVVAGLDETACKLFFKSENEKWSQFVEHVLEGFWCPKCDGRIANDHELRSKILHLPDIQTVEIGLDHDYIHLQSIFFNLLYDESSEEVQVACVGVIRRILLHGVPDIVLKTKSEWVKCVENLLLHKKKAVREAFCMQISFFLEDSVLSCLFLDGEASDKTKEQKFLDKIKHALAAAEDPQVFETLLESTAEIMIAVDIQSQIFLFSLILLVDQLDNPHLTVRMTASRLIHRSCFFHLKGGFELILSKVVHIRNELYDYLSTRVASRPKMVQEFAESVIGVETEDLVKKMVPVVLPKLVVTQQDDNLAVVTLQELAKCLDTDMEIFAAALPALLDELVCFLDVGDLDEISKRLARVPQMIKEVAKVLTGSEDLPGFLRNHFVGLLNSIDRKMLHAEDLALQKQALKRIEMLIKLMGSHLSTYVPKLMVLLMHAIDKESLQSEGLSVLHFFIGQLAKVSPSSTKHVISQVFAALIPFLEREKENLSIHLNKVVEILEELVFENKAILKQHIREFPPLPSIPALMKVNEVIQDARGSMNLKDQLLDIVDGLDHENLNVRYMVACELSKLLNLRRDDITALITGEAGSHMDVLSSLITSLLRGCAEESRTVVGQRLKLICADCLGALGAVDPAKVKGISCQRFKIECSDDDLIFELIHKHLARAFRAAPDTIVQDSAALAIQELLKIAGYKEPLKRLWDRFSNYVKEIIAPCLTSRFQLPNVVDSASAGPIYRPSMSFRRWIFFWIRKLTVLATGSRASIFNSCRGIVRHDMQTAIYLLPYLVLNAVCHGSKEARYGITAEILSVLDAAASDNSGAADHESGGQSEVCIQAVFTLLDNLGQWVDDVEQDIALSQSFQSALLAAIPKVTLAKASFRCQAYARSLMYFESHVRGKSGSFNPAAEKGGFFEDEDISFLMEIYSGLDEPDGLSGLACLRTSLSLQDQLLINKKAGNWAEVLTSSEQALQMEPTSVQRHSDVLNCLLNMCHLQAMVIHVDGLISRIPKYKKTWCMQGVQAAWRLSRWELMDEYLDGADKEGLLCSSSESNASFDMDVVKILQAMMKKDQFSVAEKIALSKQALIAPLAAAGMDSYTRAYPFVVKLHMLRELEDFHQLLVDESFLEKSFDLADLRFTKMMENWGNRLRFTQPSLWAREPLLALRRLVLGASGLGAQVGDCWLQYAKLCRSAGHYETANRAILEAQASGSPNVHMEKAKLLWSTRRSDGAIAELQQSLLNMPVEINRDIAKTLLLYSRWIHYTGQKQKEDVMSLYSRVRELQPRWEKGYFYMAKYCDEVLVDARKRQEENFEPCPRIIPSKSAIGLHRGHKNLFQALPRLLTLWFDFGSVYQRSGSSSNKEWKNIHGKVMGIMRGCLKDLPTYQWLTVLPQLVSRICHQNEEIVRLVKLIITSVLRQYPQQALWIMAAVSKSTRMMPLGIIMPIQQSLTVTLPAYEMNHGDSLISDIFTSDLPTISGIADEAEILSSLQRPKKIVLLGSDGVQCPFLCKPKDDLRKDARMMEFTAMINRLLSKYPESRRRKLYIRTFAVIPLTEDCGMVEWVPHTRGLRHILQDIYISCGKFDRQKTNPQIKRIYDQCQGKMLEDEMLKNKILPMFPPVFHKWFLNNFSEPAAWFRARLAYSHTTAVWSMVGHIVGLGDRHGENILFDSTTGDCVHVDFSCLFDKGLQLEKPELVPFRLTQNMIDGLGITGYEGIFLRVSEITLSVLRTHRETLVSILETFIHDPLVEWTKSHKSSGVEVQNPHAQRAISNIEARLQGIVVGVGAAPSLPLAVEGQARRLIAEAVSHKNLGKMYIWWMPWF
ncbi:unnamed protein product, partial [Vitis vinifera]